MNIEVVVNFGYSVVFHHKKDVSRVTKEVDSGHVVPLSGRAKASVDHHNDPRGEAFIQVEVLTILYQTLPSRQESNNWDHTNLEIVFHLSGVLVDVIHQHNKRCDSERQNYIEHDVS